MFIKCINNLCLRNAPSMAKRRPPEEIITLTGPGTPTKQSKTSNCQEQPVSTWYSTTYMIDLSTLDRVSTAAHIGRYSLAVRRYICSIRRPILTDILVSQHCWHIDQMFRWICMSTQIGEYTQYKRLTAYCFRYLLTVVYWAFKLTRCWPTVNGYSVKYPPRLHWKSIGVSSIVDGCTTESIVVDTSTGTMLII